jgi:hypothetical protein
VVIFNVIYDGAESCGARNSDEAGQDFANFNNATNKFDSTQVGLEACLEILGGADRQADSIFELFHV